MAESESQKRWNAHWKKHHKDKQRMYSDKSAAKRFIRKCKNIKDLKILLLLIKKRIEELMRK